MARQGHPESYVWDRMTANQSHWEELMYDEGEGAKRKVSYVSQAPSRVANLLLLFCFVFTAWLVGS